MLFYSTNKKIKNISFPDVLRQGLAPDGGLFMPEKFPRLPQSFFETIQKKSFQQIAEAVISQYIKEIPKTNLKKIISDSFNFPLPLKKINHQLYIAELFHGPTMAFKDFGARFLARALGYFLKGSNQTLNIIVATSGDTGSAVASGFFRVPNIHVFILYPSKQVSPLQEKQLTTFGANVTALEIKGSFDDCQRLVKQVLSDKVLNYTMPFSSANSINFGRLLPQSLYYFYAFAQICAKEKKPAPIFVTPSGNFGNLFAGLMAKRMGLPVYKFIAATNRNNIIPKYLANGKFRPEKSKRTISNAMDIGNPSNFARMAELYHQNYKLMGKDITGMSVSDSETKKTIKYIYEKYGYIIDPHTAVGVTAAFQYYKLQGNSHPLVVLSTAHPAKFKEVVEPSIGKHIPLPDQFQATMKKKKKAFLLPNKYKPLASFLLNANI